MIKLLIIECDGCKKEIDGAKDIYVESDELGDLCADCSHEMLEKKPEALLRVPRENLN